MSSDLVVAGNDSEMVELQVYGLVVTPAQARPLLLMKEKNGAAILPIALNPLEAQILAFGSDRPESPHGGPLQIFKDQGIRIEKAQFKEIRGNRQVLDITYTTSGPKNSKVHVLECFAENSMSLALAAKAPVFATHTFIDQCRRTHLDLGFGQGEALSTFGSDKIPPGLLQ